MEIRVDGRIRGELPVEATGHWAVRLPSGRHQVELVSETTAYLILDTTSLYSSWLIVVFGTVAIGLMVLIYMSVLVRRAIARMGHRGAATQSSVRGGR